MTRVVLVRHGESMGNIWPGAYRDDSLCFLTTKGTRQAEIAGLDLKHAGFKFSHIYTSGLTRARHTAVIIAQYMDDWKRDFRVDPRLNEFSSLQDETPEEFSVRVLSGFSSLMESSEGDILVVSHFYTMETILRSHSYDPGYIPNAHPYVIDGGAVAPLGSFIRQVQY